MSTHSNDAREDVAALTQKVTLDGGTMPLAHSQEAVSLPELCARCVSDAYSTRAMYTRLILQRMYFFPRNIMFDAN